MKLNISAKQWARSLTKVLGRDQCSQALEPVPALLTLTPFLHRYVPKSPAETVHQASKQEAAVKAAEARPWQ